VIPEPFRAEPLGKHHDRAAFSCGVTELDTYLQRYVGRNQRRNLIRRFVLIKPDELQRIVGCSTLSNATAIRDHDEDAPLMSPYPEIPALPIGRLAVDRSVQGKGWGRRLLMHALERAARLSKESASALGLVDPVDVRAATFYARYGFRPLASDRRMYLPMKDIRATFADAR